MADFLYNLWAIFQIILGFTFLIFVHELGHFLMAKKVGVRATQFAIGFGNALLAYRKGIGWRRGTTEPELRDLVLERAGADGKTLPENINEADIHKLADEYGYGETEYRLNWVLFGGYVKMVGQEDLDPNAASQDPRSFTKASFWGRMGIISAGVIMNAIFAVILFMIAFSIGVDFPPAVVGGVLPESPAATAVAVEDKSIVGLQTGDRVVSIEGEEASDFTNVLIAAPLGDEGVPMRFAVMRPSLDGSDPRRLTFDIAPNGAEPERGLPMPYIGIDRPLSLQMMTDDELTGPGESSLAGRGVKPGMTITAVNGRAVTEFWELQQLVAASNGQDVTLTFTDPKTEETATATFGVVPQLPSAEYTAASLDKPVDVEQLLGVIPPIKASGVVAGSPAEGAIKKDDVFVKVGEARWPTVPEIIQQVKLADRDPVDITVLRDGKNVELTLTPKRDGGVPRLGVQLVTATDANRVAAVLDDSPLKSLSLLPGDRITRVGDRAVEDYADLSHTLLAHAGQTVSVTVARHQGESRDVTYELELPAEAADQIADVGWQMEVRLPFRLLRVRQQAEGIGDAVVMGFEKTHLVMMQTYVTLLKTINGWIPVNNLSGPVGIVAQGRHITKQGFAYLLFFLGLLSMNLAVINFLPMPIVDGGLAVILIVEKLRGKPLPANVAGAINLVGLLLIATIFITLTYHDIAKIVTGG